MSKFISNDDSTKSWIQCWFRNCCHCCSHGNQMNHRNGWCNILFSIRITQLNVNCDLKTIHDFRTSLFIKILVNRRVRAITRFQHPFTELINEFTSSIAITQPWTFMWQVTPTVEEGNEEKQEFFHQFNRTSGNHFNSKLQQLFCTFQFRKESELISAGYLSAHYKCN